MGEKQKYVLDSYPFLALLLLLSILHTRTLQITFSPKPVP